MRRREPLASPRTRRCDRLSSRYGGPLYQVKRADGRLLDIGVIAGGFADAAAQDRFCAGALCYINRIYDQSGKGNDLMQAPPGPLYPGPDKGAFDTQPIADMAPITIGGGHKAYGVYIMPGMGFRNNNARDLPIDDEPAGIHAVVDGEHYSNGCCFNYGNASTNGLAVGTGTMESVYFGTSTGWGSGSGTGPWIMSDMEAGLFSGYNARVNEANPTITWRFVTGVFGGGGRNFWELKGGNAQQGGLQTFYAGVRPGSKENSAYYPMHKKGAIQMGNGGDNGNGSAGTFYEGVMTAGHPGEGVADKVQANIVAAKYDVARLTQTRLTSFTPNAVKEVTASFVNTNAAAMENVRLTVSLPAGWTARASGPATFASVAPGASVRATFQVTAPARANMGFLTLRAAWNGGADVSQQRVRSVEPVKLNEVRFASGGNATDQFIELYNAGPSPVDMSGWRLINTRTWSAPVTLAIIPAGTTIAPRSHYLLGLANSGLAAPAAAGATTVNLRSTAGLIARCGDRRRRREPHRQERRNRRHGADQGVHQCLDRALAGFPRRHDQPAGAQRRGFHRGPEDQHRPRRQYRDRHGDFGRQGRDADHAGGLHRAGRHQHQAGGAGQCQRRRHADHRYRPAHGAGGSRLGRHRGTGRHRRHADGAAQTAAYLRRRCLGPGHRHFLYPCHALCPSQRRCGAGAGQRRGARPAADACACVRCAGALSRRGQ